MTENLKIGIPSKGRLSELATGLLNQAGIAFRRQERTLFARVKQLPIEIIFLRTDDIPVLCEEGAIDIGITGSDLIEESGADVTVRMPLGVGHCKLSLCVPEDSKIETCSQLDGLRMASSFPRVTNQFLAKHNAKVHMVELSGSVEIMIALGVADAIVDLVETGSTLAANRLRILTDIGHYQTVLIQNKKGRLPEVVDRVVRRLEGVVIARDYSLLEYNVPRNKLAEAELITPGFNSPTISSLEDPAWCSVRTMVHRKEVIDAMERLEVIGASAILETEIGNCRL
ncbi:ATP phosphoribosyltransferase [Aureliella helgolandensis]|uniref:ATP phosphoribosyltransferase n=1 Tax=Aureliella helgolandensis TaxID=2527968 RepID=A0A518G8A9_9BACT|nr:ATP phosphoribosyltransferase [Aureliella helgolandensis]QDV24819.1 ATP phosphoribosyltransferase [Aureliella helgolandensis]